MPHLLVLGKTEISLPNAQRDSLDARIEGIMDALQVLPPPQHNPIYLSELWQPWSSDFYLPLNWQVFTFNTIRNCATSDAFVGKWL